jgi:hypothetical protein
MCTRGGGRRKLKGLLGMCVVESVVRSGCPCSFFIKQNRLSVGNFSLVPTVHSVSVVPRVLPSRNGVCRSTMCVELHLHCLIQCGKGGGGVGCFSTGTTLI